MMNNCNPVSKTDTSYRGEIHTTRQITRPFICVTRLHSLRLSLPDTIFKQHPTNYTRSCRRVV